MKFHRNTGQYHSNVAFVCFLEKESRAYDAYRGAGPYWATIDNNGEVVDLDEANDTETDFTKSDLGEVDGNRSGGPSAFPMEIGVRGSCYELVVMHGSATAALLGLLVK